MTTTRRDLVNVDPAVAALLDDLPPNATKSELHTRIALCKMQQARIRGNSDYAAKVMDAAIEEGMRDRSMFELLEQRMRELDRQVASLDKEKKVKEQETTTKEDEVAKEDKAEMDSKEGDGDEPIDSPEVAQLKKHADEVEQMLEERLLDEIMQIKEEQEMIRQQETRLRKRLRSLQLAIQKVPNEERSANLLVAMNDAYDYTVAGKAECAVCRDRDATKAVIPCGHLCLCDECTTTLADDTKLSQCPLCRGHLLSTLKIYALLQ